MTAFLLDDIASAEALDDWTLEVHLREPRNYFPYVLASHWSYPWPRHLADEVGAAWRRPESLVGNGPFMLCSVDEDGAHLCANPHWRSASGNVGDVHVVFRERGAEPSLEEWLSGRFDLEMAGDAPAASKLPMKHRRRTRTDALDVPLGLERRQPADAHQRVRRDRARHRPRRAAAETGVDQAVERGGASRRSRPGTATTSR